jgi:preprotein translocase subunit SecA
MFSFMMDELKNSVISILATVRFKGEEDADAVSQQSPDMSDIELQHSDPGAPKESLPEHSDDKTNRPYVRVHAKVGRNEPCPCGSGKKFKKCHGTIRQ